MAELGPTRLVVSTFKLVKRIISGALLVMNKSPLVWLDQKEKCMSKAMMASFKDGSNGPSYLPI